MAAAIPTKTGQGLALMVIYAKNAGKLIRQGYGGSNSMRLLINTKLVSTNHTNLTMPDKLPNKTELETLFTQIGSIFQRMADTIVQAFQSAQLDPQQAAKIQKIAAALREIRDHPRR